MRQLRPRKASSAVQYHIQEYVESDESDGYADSGEDTGEDDSNEEGAVARPSEILLTPEPEGQPPARKGERAWLSILLGQIRRCPRQRIPSRSIHVDSSGEDEWTPREKTLLFHGIERWGRHRPERIATRIPNKSPEQCRAYIDLLQRACTIYTSGLTKRERARERHIALCRAPYARCTPDMVVYEEEWWADKGVMRENDVAFLTFQKAMRRMQENVAVEEAKQRIVARGLEVGMRLKPRIFVMENLESMSEHLWIHAENVCRVPGGVVGCLFDELEAFLRRMIRDCVEVKEEEHTLLGVYPRGKGLNIMESTVKMALEMRGIPRTREAWLRRIALGALKWGRLIDDEGKPCSLEDVEEILPPPPPPAIIARLPVPHGPTEEAFALDMVRAAQQGEVEDESINDEVSQKQVYCGECRIERVQGFLDQEYSPYE